MADQADIDAINAAAIAAAQSPQSASQDGASVTARPIDDLIKAKALAEQQGVTVGQLFGNRTRLIPGPRQ